MVFGFDNFKIQQSNFHHQGRANEQTPNQECPKAAWGPLNDPVGTRGPFEPYNHHGRQQESAISGQGCGLGFRARMMV